MKGPRIPVSQLAPAVLLVLLGALVGATLAGGQSTPPDPRPHLLVVPETADGVTALARTDARVVAEYESFTLVEAAGADEERLRGAGAERRDDMRAVQTAAGSLDPSTERRSLAAKQAPERDETLALVQFVGPPKEAWLGRVRATGARLVTYQAENGYVVHARGEAVDRLAALMGSDPAVRAVAVLTAADKLERGRASAYAVSTVSGAAGADARADASGAGPSVAVPTSVGAIRTQYLRLPAAAAAELARAPAVVAVEPYAEPELADERAAQIVAGNLVAPAFTQPAGPGYLSWVDGAMGGAAPFGFAIDVTDEGLDASPPAHPDFSGRISYLNDYTADPDARDCGGHGTNVASIAAGYNDGTGPSVEDGAGYNHGLGVAPFARLGASKIFACDGSFAGGAVIPALTESAYDGEARVSNNSWGSPDWGSYTPRARQYDLLVRDAHPDVGHQPMVEVFAAGNDGEAGYGTVHAEGTAKNVITVGASEGVRPSGTDGCGTTNAGADSARDVVDFSSRGPTNDGRLKPDLVAPGTHITGARPLHPGYTGDGTCNPFFAGSYSLVTGTSQATPQVSGAAALVRQWYDSTHPDPPSPALTKALLINTATDLAGGQNGKGDTIAGGPNTDQGWGRVNAGAALDSTAREYRDQLSSDAFDASGQSRVISYAVADDEKPVKVTLVWTDAPGNTTGDAFVNNLDLEVAHGGKTYKGNQFGGAFSRAGGVSDERNNVESVYLPESTDSTLAVTVRGTSIGGNGIPGVGDATDQDFALVVSNAEEEPAPVIVGGETRVIGDLDGALETAEDAQLEQDLRNAGDTAAGGVTATLTGPAVTSGGSSYEDLGPGETETNAPPYELSLPDTAPCGEDVTGSLAVDTLAPLDSQEVPVVVPTGETGTPQDHSAASPQVPVNIPDDNAAGVTSQLFVSDRGRIKDLDVEISDLRHTWVGDLALDLTSPEGTTVRLVEHPGGPDNDTDDMPGVVFDDEASGTINAGPWPVIRRFHPLADQLSRFDGEQRRGTWTLRVRDLFDGDEGSLLAWKLTSSRAICNEDPDPPETSLDSGPSGLIASRGASFGFSSPDADKIAFECQLDGASYEPCDSGQRQYTGLADGGHTFRVRAIDGSDNEDASPAERTWSVDATPPATGIASAPAGAVASGSASFAFSSEAGATFECRLDGGAFQACSSPQTYGGLADGSHSFEVRATDALGNVESPGATRTWRVDTVAPRPSISSPGTTADTTPRLSGSAGTAEGDAGTVTVKLFAGTLAAGLPAQTLVASRGSGGAWAVTATPLTPGRYTARVEQSDSLGHLGVSPSATLEVVAPAPSFVVGPAEERISDALAGRLTVMAACASACRVEAKLSRGRAALGRGSKRLGAATAGAVRVRMTKAGRAALRGRASVRAELRVTLTGGAGKLQVTRRVVLRRVGGPRALAGRGLRLWAAATESAPLELRLSLSAREARRLGLKSKGGAYLLSAKRFAASRAAKTATLAIVRAARDELRRARKLTARLEAVAEARAPSPARRATLGLSTKR